jgi:Reverse transcriptase (RNA-dependent DNA polymerase)
MTTRNKDHTRIPKQFPDFIAYNTSLHETEPKSYKSAQQQPQWQQAMQLEYLALLHNRTWKLVPPPVDQSIIGCKWIYKIKRKADGTIDRYKARLVAKGFHQEEGINYFETFSPVVRPTTIRLVLTIALTYGWSLRQLDVQNAFLHGDLQETIYMEQPPGFVDPRCPNHVCLLSKSLYGLKQSLRAWFQTLSNCLTSLGFSPSHYDPSLFVLHHNSQTVIILIYVDDIIITGSHQPYLFDIISKLQTHFAIKDLGDLHYFLGIEVTKTDTGLHLSQHKYVQDILHRALMHESKPFSSPMAPNLQLSKHDGDPLLDTAKYRTIVGALQFATITRPDIAFAVNKVSQFMHAPTDIHWATVKRILRYLKGTSDHGITLNPAKNFQLFAYCDADWAGCPDDRRSTTGYCIYLGSNLLSWSSKKQPTVARSSTEAEYRSLAVTSAELIWLHYLMAELQLSCTAPPILYCDNVGATYLASNPMFHARTKHVEIDFHFVRDRIISRNLTVQFLSSADQLADIMTKPLSISRFLNIRSKLTVTKSPATCGGLLEDATEDPYG